MVATTYRYVHGNKAVFAVDEGNFTTSSDYVMGGYFASPLTDSGYPVCLDTTRAWTVKKAASPSDVVIGITEDVPMGKGERYGRNVTVKLFGQFIDAVELKSDSAAVSIGDRLQIAGERLWAKDTTPGINQSWTLSGNPETISYSPSFVVALESASSAEISAGGKKIHVLFGATF